jgi:hypothetical protein
MAGEQVQKEQETALSVLKVIHRWDCCEAWDRYGRTIGDLVE